MSVDYLASGLGTLGFQVARGEIDGMYAINKFGRNIEIDAAVTADIWDGGETLASGGESLIWVAPTQARTHTIASSDAGDTSGGAGARTLQVYGLTDWDTAEVSETVTMNTGSPPVTDNSYVIIHRMKVLTKGATNVNIGEITATATGDGTVTAKILAGQGQTQMAIYGIPSTQKMYLTSVYASYNKAGGNAGNADLSLLQNPEPDDELTNFLVKHTWSILSTGTSTSEIHFDPPKTLSGPCIVKIQALSGVNDSDIDAGFNGVIVDN